MENKKPNVIFVLTDDQGYGDLGCTGNPNIHTPCIDEFYRESCRFTDYHVAPLCAPTRGALFTGHRPLRNGVWATCWGRSILHENETTIAEIFAQNGYVTGLFGKWHLGDNYPYRPQDRGFMEVVAHKGGGVGQTPDFWGNNYFDDTYFNKGVPTQYDGYCTDVWIEAAEKFMENHLEIPFFVTITTNAPHEPYLVEDRYAKEYRDHPEIVHPEFYGMISNIDENFGKLRKKLSQWGIEDNTILIFMTDNGTSGGCEVNEREEVVRGYNAQMRGMKASYYDGGHRVPFFICWPEGGIDGGKDICDTAFHVDFFPTLVDLCGLKMPDLDLDGISLKPALLEGRNLSKGRMEFMQYHQSTIVPEKWENAVICDQWRLVRGKELYDIQADPGQKKDLSDRYPEIVQKMRDAHEDHWEKVQEDMHRYAPIYLGDEHENPTRLDAMDVMGDVTWNQLSIALAKKSTGLWRVKFTRPGKYRFELCRWPKEVDLTLDETLSEEKIDALAPYAEVWVTEEGRLWKEEKICREFSPAKAVIKFFNQEYVTNVSGNAVKAVFEISVDRTGETDLTADFIDLAGEHTGAYYVYVECL